MGEVSPALFQKLGKISLTLGKNTLITVIRVLNFSFKVQFKRVSRKKTWRFLSSVVDDCLSKCPHPKKNLLSWNISGYAPVITLPFDFGERNFSYQKVSKYYCSIYNSMFLCKANWGQIFTKAVIRGCFSKYNRCS